MYRYIVMLSLVLFSCLTSAQAEDTVEVTVFDLASLKQAIIDANGRSPDTHTLIGIPAHLYIPDYESLPPIDAAITITGGTFHGVDGGPAQLFFVESTARLQFNSSQFIDFSLTFDGPGLIENHGELTLIGVTLSSISGDPFCTGKICVENKTPIVFNSSSGDLKFKGVRIVDSGTLAVNQSPQPRNGVLRNDGRAELLRTQIYLSHNRWEAPLSNSGYMKLHNSSFFIRNQFDIPSVPLLRATDSAETESVNSVFDGFTGDWCQLVDSIGFNSTDSPECDWSSPGDLIGMATGLIWRRTGDLGSGHSYGLVPSAASAIVDSASSEWCPGDLWIVDGNGDGIAACDRGAVELGPISLAEGGINGFYYNPENDGHYLYVLETDFLTLVVWTTFDPDGNQIWVYGTGELVNGRSVIADTYINRSGGFSPDGMVTNVEAEHWGQLQVDMESCTQGLVAYRSDLPEFGNGQFPIERLAYVKQLGCIDTK